MLLFDKSLLLKSVLLALVLAVVAYWLAIPVLQQPYYLSVFLPLAMMFCLLLAWFMHLRDDGFSQTAKGESGGQEVSISPEEHIMQDKSTIASQASRGAALEVGQDDEEKRLGLSMLAPMDDVLVQRRSVHRASRNATADDPKAAVKVFLLAALQLAILATLLYFSRGIGASFHL